MNPIYRFQLSDDEDSNQAFPVWSGSLSLDFDKEVGWEFFRKKLNGKLTFVNADYAFIMSHSFDQRFGLTIEVSFNGGASWTSYWSGFFYKTDCEFDMDEQTVRVTPNTEDVYGAILAGLDNEYNLIDLAPEIAKIKYDKRALLQIYSPGESVVSCFLSGMWWEQECEVVTNTTTLTQTYKFGQISTRSVYRISGNVNITLLAWDENWVFTQNEESGPGGDYWLTELFYEPDGSRWFLESAPGDPQPDFPITLQPDTSTAATSSVTIEQTAFSLYGRLLLDVADVYGQSTYQLPQNDIVENNRNYHRVIPYTDSSGIVISDRMSNEATKWGLYQPGQYYARPYAIGLTDLYPVARSTWDNLSVWFAFSSFNMLIDEASRQPYVLNDAYPLYSVISVILKQIAPNVTHGDGVNYSMFLYGAWNVSGIKQGNWRPFITPKSNILNGNYDMPASKAPITLRQILDMLRDCFRCYWFVDSNNRFRIEHIQYFRNGGRYTGNPIVAINLTQRMNTRNEKMWAFGTSKFKFEKPDMPQRYEFSWMDDVTDVFEGWPIEMISEFVEKGRVDKIIISHFTSDIDYMLLNPGACSQDGFALIGAYQQTTPAEYQWYVPYVSSAVYQWQNGYFAFRFLEEYYLYDLPASLYSFGDSGERTALGVKKLKTQDVSFPWKTDPITTYLIKTEIGNGQIGKLSINLSSRNVKATLHYDTEQ